VLYTKQTSVITVMASAYHNLQPAVFWNIFIIQHDMIMGSAHNVINNT